MASSDGGLDGNQSGSLSRSPARKKNRIEEPYYRPVAAEVPYGGADSAYTGYNFPDGPYYKPPTPGSPEAVDFGFISLDPSHALLAHGSADPSLARDYSSDLHALREHVSAQEEQSPRELSFWRIGRWLSLDGFIDDVPIVRIYLSILRKNLGLEIRTQATISSKVEITPPTTRQSTGNAPVQSQELLQSFTTTTPGVEDKQGDFRCSFPGCSYQGGFKRKYELQRHLEGHSEGARLPCPLAHCTRRDNEGFYRPDKLRDHVRSAHSGEFDRLFQCPFCEDEIGLQSSIQQHVTDRHPAATWVPPLLMNFASPSDMLARLARLPRPELAPLMHGPPPVASSAEKAGEQPESHEPKEGASEAQPSHHLTTSVIKSRELPICEDCGRSYSRPSEMRRHRRAKHNTTIPAFLCEVCGKAFDFEKDRQRHMTSHTTTAELVCGIEECTSRFKRKDNMLRHQREHH